MVMRYCGGCKQEKDESEFWINQNKCKECRRAYDKKRYQTVYKTRRKESVEDWGNRQVQMVRELKTKTPCADCGGKFHFAAMHFDHLPGYQKEMVIANNIRSVSVARLEAEIAKCEIVCANCHAVRTYQRADKAL